MKFSKPVTLRPIGADSYKTAGGVARISEDIAVAAWRDTVTGNGVSWYLRAIRYTTEGPQLGPLRAMTSPAEHGIPASIVSGPEGEVWVVLEDQTLYVSAVGGDSRPRLVLGKVTVDPVTLACSWQELARHVHERANDGWLVTAWPEENRLLVWNNSRRLGLPVQPWYELLMFDMSNGSVVVKRPDDTQQIFAAAMALHKESGTVLLMSNKSAGSAPYQRTEFWTCQVTSNSISPIVDRGYLTTTPVYYIRWAYACAVPDGFRILYMSSYDNAYVRLLKYELATGAITEQGKISWYGGSYTDRNYDESAALVRDEDLDRVIAFYTDRGYGSSPVRGLAYVDVPEGTYAVDAREFLPGTRTISTSGTLDACVVAPGHYVFFAASEGIGQPQPATGSFGYPDLAQRVWLGGEDQVSTTPTPGPTSEETRRAFRRLS